MSLASCSECWEDVCVCGHRYKDFSPESKKKIVELILGERVYSLGEVTYFMNIAIRRGIELEAGLVSQSEYGIDAEWIKKQIG